LKDKRVTQPFRKKLIEVAIPLEAINAASAREKSIRHGHPSTLHLWWARRPLAACRAVLFAQLVDDPSSLPDQFPTAELQDAERKRLFAIIEDLVKWENTTNEEVLERARAEIRRSCGGVLPPVYDPFSGGGSIPLEAQRLGLPAYGSDLNPVAVMIGKAMIEIPPKFKDMPPLHPGIKDRSFYRNAEGLAEDVSFYAEWMREKAWERIGHLYPEVDLPKAYGSGKAPIIAWIWARTVASPEPSLRGKHVPLANTYILSKKKGREAIAEIKVNRDAGTFDIAVKTSGVTENELRTAQFGSRSARAEDFLCAISGVPITREYIREEGKVGRIGTRLIAVVVDVPKGRGYIAPTVDDLRTAQKANEFACVDESRSSFLSGNTPTRAMITGGVCSAYGFTTWGSIYTDRQLVALNTLSDLVQEAKAQILENLSSVNEYRDAKSYADAIALYLGLCVGRMANRSSSLCFWDQAGENIQQVFARFRRRQYFFEFLW
jgi:putative DNA methylase